MQTSNQPPSSTETNQAGPFFRPKLTSLKQTKMIHNFSSIHLSHTDVELLSKGLSFTPTPKIQTPTAYFNLLHQFDYYANSIRSQYVSHFTSKDLKITDMPIQSDSNTPQIFQKMKFLKNKSIPPHPSDTCNNTNIENYIHSKKIIISKKLKKLFIPQNKHNLTKQQQTTIKKKLYRSRHTITIKPADKNLGIGALNTHDYLQQCIRISPNTTVPTRRNKKDHHQHSHFLQTINHLSQ